jgi:hypothetical protein
MRDVAVSCCVLKLLPGGWDGKNPVVFWEHSSGECAGSAANRKTSGDEGPRAGILDGLMRDPEVSVVLYRFSQ